MNNAGNINKAHKPARFTGASVVAEKKYIQNNIIYVLRYSGFLHQ
jgi:hypothetical protein